MLTRKFLAVFCFALCFLIACKKPIGEDRPAPTNRLSKIVYEQNNVSYEYDNNGRLKSSTFRAADNTLIGKTEYEYSNGRLAQSVSGNARLVYSYPNNQTIRIELRNGNTTRYSFEYKITGNQINEWIQYGHGTGAAVPEEKHVYTYNSAGNIIKTENYEYNGGQWELYEVINTVQYDNRQNYTSHHEAIMYYIGDRAVLANNPVKQEYRAPDGQLFKTLTYQHTYDAQGRKTRSVISIVEPGENDKTETITYQY